MKNIPKKKELEVSCKKSIKKNTCFIKKGVFTFLCCILFLQNNVAQTTPSGFETIFYEGFDYNTGETLQNQNGGTGFTANWGRVSIKQGI